MTVRIIGVTSPTILASQSDDTGAVTLDSSSGVHVSLPTRTSWVVMAADVRTEGAPVRHTSREGEPGPGERAASRPRPKLAKRSRADLEQIKDQDFFSRE